MYKIGICDDDAAFGCQMERYLKEYSEKERIEIETEIFTSGEEYLDFLEKEPKLDLLFLDIELGKKINGVQVGSILRAELSNEVTQIVYVSAKEDYAMQLFRSRPMDFLIKPIGKEEIERVMSEYKKLFVLHKKFFEYHVGRTERRITFGEIMYFQCNGKKICINTVKDVKLEFYGKMADVKIQLNHGDFLEIHKSYIVNIDCVSEFYVNEVIMINGEKLPVSQSLRKKVQQRLLEINIERR